MNYMAPPHFWNWIYGDGTINLGWPTRTSWKQHSDPWRMLWVHDWAYECTDDLLRVDEWSVQIAPVQVCIHFLMIFLAYSRDMKKHRQQLLEVLQLMRKHKWYAKHSKCEFRSQQVTCLGHSISKLGVSIRQEKVEAVRILELPQGWRGCRHFLGWLGITDDSWGGLIWLHHLPGCL